MTVHFELLGQPFDIVALHAAYDGPGSQRD
jgi:hypothetical protein